ncbi:unnamed protein product [Spirodela intermedia]|uniref:Agenet domain-containing protein n=1 Tax=Spirodela intermedia TaxID=51605 RepID=A0A7I8K3B6_SPIIN|nr:unnamed protein product [Spirodela intermedia]
MDYDGNDFQSQNFQLSGEDNSRFSSGLRSFSLPKFELDEHFQVNLRFDSLVEPESLIGIQDQEERNWIEDFSSGNAALEFNSGPAEPCSISRRKNVWSEATSSESVEILLKSVGEDDVINKRTSFIDLDAHNELSGVNNHMDPSCFQDSSVHSKGVTAMNEDSVLLPEKCEKELPRLNESVTAELPDAQVTSNTFNDENLEGRIVDEMNISPCKVVSDDCILKEVITAATDKSFVTKEKSFDNNDNEMTLDSCQLDDEFVEKSESGDNSAQLVAEEIRDTTIDRMDPRTFPVKSSAKDSGNLSSKEIVEQIRENYPQDVLPVGPQILVTDGSDKVENQIVKKGSGHTNENSEVFVPKLGHVVPEGLSNLEMKIKPSSLLMEGYSKHAVSEKDGLLEDVAHQIEILSKGNASNGQTVTASHETDVLVIKGKISPEDHSVESSRSDDTKQSAWSTKIDSFEHVKGPHDASSEPQILLENHDLQIQNVLMTKTAESVDDYGRRKLKEPLISPEESEDAQCHQPERSKGVEDSLIMEHEIKSTGNGAQGREERDNDDLGFHKFELASGVSESAEVQKSSEDEVPKNHTMDVDDSTCAPGQVVLEVINPNGRDEDSENVGNFHTQNTNPSEKYSTGHELESGDPTVQSARSSVRPDNLKSQMNEKLGDSSGQDQDAHILSDPAERRPIMETIRAIAVDSNENSLQSVNLPGSSSERQMFEAEHRDPSSLEPVCGSPTIIGCAEPSSGGLDHQEVDKQSSEQSLSASGVLPQASSVDEDLDSNKLNTCDPKESNASEERTFTFEVGSTTAISEKSPVSGWKPFSIMESYEAPPAEEMCSTTPGLKKASPKAVSEPRPSVDINSKKTHKDKTRSAPSGSTERSTSSRRRSAKEISPQKDVNKKNGTSSNPPVNTVPIVSRDMQRDEKYQYSYNEGGGSKNSDLSTGSTLFLQPFTDSQQVQLRAQIFVYGSLIQGIPPDEACMISAFGNTGGSFDFFKDSDSTRSAWEGTWRVSAERFNSQKSPSASFGTPLPSHSDVKISGARVHEQPSRSTPLQSKPHVTPVNVTASRTIGKGSSTVISNLMSLPSPLWHDVSQSGMTRGPHLDPNQIFSPAHGYQSSHAKQYPGSGNPWLSQASSLPWVASSQTSVPWVTPSQTSMPDTRTHFSGQLTAETTQATPVRDSSLPQSSNLQFLTTSSFFTSGVPLSSSGTTTLQAEPASKMSPHPEKKHATSNQKTRKRRKNEVSPHVLPDCPPHTELDSTKHLPIPMSSLSAISSSVSPTHFQLIGDHGKEQKAMLSEETCSKIEQAKLQAEDAAAFAAAAIKHSEGIWSQLTIQRNSGQASEIEAMLASAAVAAAAASSVAKAAAAAAKVASDAAMQAKLMFDEAVSSRTGSDTLASQIFYNDQGTNLPRATPVSVFKGKDKATSSTSVISAAKEAARRRVEAASAASKRAENLDAIVKAAELAAVAVCQAGAVIAMGDPLPFTLNDLVEAGPEGYWKAPNAASGYAAMASTNNEKQAALEFADGHNKSLQGVAPFDAPDPELSKDHGGENLKERYIQEGSLVEVLFDEDNARRIWYSAKVLSLKDGKAYVNYNDFPANAGSDKQKEWIPLEGQVDKPPRIRIAHPFMTVKYEGTRKRRRAAVGNFLWAVGDRVDAWVHNGWCEGVVTEKSKEDETKLTVHFSAGGAVSIIRAWHLRPSLVWKDGQWVEWSRLRENTSYPIYTVGVPCYYAPDFFLNYDQGDTPKDKRQKLGKLEAENHPKLKSIDLGKQSANFQIGISGKLEESRPLLLSEKDKIFSVGKNTEGSNLNALKMRRTGQKEGSRVVFGVPKPGKKRKFMEVSKHYVTGKIENVSEGSDALKNVKYLPTQTSGVWKNASKVESKGRKGGEPKPKVIRPVRPQSSQTRGATEREGPALSSALASNQGTAIPTAKASGNLEEQAEKSISGPETFTNILGTEDSGVLESSMRHVAAMPTSKKKAATSSESDGTKGKVASALERTKSEERYGSVSDRTGKLSADAGELRRSNRRIQPTSRVSPA